MRSTRSRLTRAFSVLLLGTVVVSSATAGTFETDSSAEASLLKRKVRAAIFLHRATFGPTIEEIDALAAEMVAKGTRKACSDWIDDQLALPASLHEPLAIDMYQGDGLVGDESDGDSVWIQRYKFHAWWHNALNAEDQLRQRMAWALIQILVTSEDGAGFNDRNLGNGRPTGQNLPRWLGVVDYYDTLVSGAFGNYRDLLENVTYHPIMGVYLSSMRNRKTDGVRVPDENYAREIMQLFTIGLYELNLDGSPKRTTQGELIPTYDNDTIQELAKVFTGLTFQPNASNNWNTFWSGNDFDLPMAMYQPEHDTTPKVLFGGAYTIDDPQSDGENEIDEALDILFEHDNTAPFIAYRLIQRFVKSNPSRGYVRRVARKFENNGQGVRGDLGAVVKAVLLDPEAWRSVRIVQRRSPDRVIVTSRGTEYSRLREPLLRYAHFMRSAHPTTNYGGDGLFRIRPIDWVIVQESYRSPSVFNFWLTDYQPAGDIVSFQPSRRITNGALVAPEFQMKTSVTSNYFIQLFIWQLDSAEFNVGNNQPDKKFFFNWDAEKAMVEASEGDEGLVNLVDYLDLLHCCGTMPQEYKDKIVEIVNYETRNQTADADYSKRRFVGAALAVLASPFCAIAE
ncbi:DUF1800 domain-containing protein [Rubripirellula amarantea]|nr:DUF1800 family protein [Rubripirellula amarantea]